MGQQQRLDRFVANAPRNDVVARAGAAKYRWLMENLFIASAARHTDRVVIDVHQVL